MEWEQEDILVTVKAYPEPSKTYRETSCVAGVTASGKPVRIFPIPARDLEEDNQFRKYSLIAARIRKATDDARPESHKIDFGNIRELYRLKTDDRWSERSIRVEPFRVATSLEELQNRFKNDRTAASPSLALIRPKEVISLKLEKRDRDGWNEAELSTLVQPTLFDSRQQNPLEFIPYRFKYQFLCDDSRCTKPHSYSVLDWEMNQTYRKWRREYGEADWESKFRLRFEEEFIEKKDLQFFVGTMKNKPWVWTIVGLFYPPKSTKSEMVNLTLPL